ncbi:MAG: mandelate racemase/muconate lactonizing enzyme family protein [Pseudomonadota bacterium]
MRISLVEVYQVDLPVKGGLYRLSGGREYRSFDATLVRLVAEEGLDGWGETTPFGGTYIAAHGAGVRAALTVLGPAVLGLDPRLTDRIGDAMDAVLDGHLSAKAAIDIACWDLFGKSVGMAVCDLLGGRIPGRVPVISSIGSDTPEAMRASVARHRASGFRGHSIKIGAAETDGGPSLDAERLEACLADRQPGEWFLADANGGMTPEQVLRFLALLPSGLDFVLEAPCATWRETLSLRARCSVPILVDELLQSEGDLAQVIAADAADGVGLKITKQGGLTRTRRMRDTSAAAGLVMSIQDTTGSDLCFAAILHVAQSTPRRHLRCALDPRETTDRLVGNLHAPIREGGAEAPDLPGLGIEIDRARLGPPVASYG